MSEPTNNNGLQPIEPRPVPSLDVRDTYFLWFREKMDEDFAGLIEKFLLQLPLHKAVISEGELQRIVCYLWSIHSILDLSQKTVQQRAVLSLLIRTGDLARVKEFLESMDPQEKQLLLSHGAPLDTILSENLGATPEILTYLMESGAVLGGTTWLMKAVLLHRKINSPYFPHLYKVVKREVNDKELIEILNLPTPSGQTIFHLAVIHQIEQSTLLQLVLDGAKPLKDDQGRTPFHLFASNKDLCPLFPSLFACLRRPTQAAVMKAEDNRGETVLSLMINVEASYATIKYLLAKGAKLDPRSCKGRADFTPLHYAVFAEASIEVLEELIKGMTKEEKAQFVNQRDRNGFTALHYAANRLVDIAMVDWLLKAGALAKIQSEKGYTAFHSAAFIGNIKALPLLCSSISDPLERSRVLRLLSEKGSALSLIIQDQMCLDSIPLLLDNGADINDLQNAGLSDLQILLYTRAPKERFAEILQSLTQEQRQILLNKPDLKYGRTILHLAVISHAEPEIIEMLIAMGALHQMDKKGFTPLVYVDFSNPNALTICQAMITGLTQQQRNEAVNFQFSDQTCLLAHIIRQKADYALIASFLRWGARVDIADNNGEYPLHSTVNHPMALEVASRLLVGVSRELRKKMLLSGSPHSDASLLDHVIHQKNLELLALLLQDLDPSDSLEVLNFVIGEYSCLHGAVMKGVDPPILRFLVQSGANVNRKLETRKGNLQGNTPLHLAATLYPHSLRAWLSLLEPLSPEARREALNERNGEGDTVLHVGLTYCSIEIIKLLLSYGASPNIANEKGDTPLHVANQRHAFSIIQLFLQAGADPSLLNNKEQPALENPHQMLNMIRNLERDWGRFSYKRDASNRIVECRFENPAAEEGTFCILQGEYDQTKAFSIYPDNLDDVIQRTVEIGKNYRHTWLKVVSDVDSLAEALESIPGEIDRLHLEGHGPGDDLSEQQQIALSKTVNLYVGDPKLEAILPKKLSKRCKVVVFSCGSARKEPPGLSNHCEQIARLGFLVFGSERTFYAYNVRYLPEDPVDIRFFDNDGKELTVAFRDNNRSYPSEWVHC